MCSHILDQRYPVLIATSDSYARPRFSLGRFAPQRIFGWPWRTIVDTPARRWKRITSSCYGSFLRLSDFRAARNSCSGTASTGFLGGPTPSASGQLVAAFVHVRTRLDRGAHRRDRDSLGGGTLGLIVVDYVTNNTSSTESWSQVCPKREKA